jgi:cellulose synthase/poly-beta-1,6-N-acetylglucosamine synthase-like glycosyltransferase
MNRSTHEYTESISLRSVRARLPRAFFVNRTEMVDLVADRNVMHAPTTREIDAPRASVVVPVGSVDHRFERQLKAVCSQAPPFEFEVVVSLNSVDAAVRDEVHRVVSRMGDPRVRVVDSSDRRGAAHARNVGARASAAPVLAFCDADDEVHPGWLEALVGGLDGRAAVTGMIRELAPASQRDWRPPATPGDLPRFLGHSYVLSGNLAIQRAAFDAVGGFDEDLTRCEDIAISCALAQGGHRIGFCADAVIDYHHRNGLLPMLRQHYRYGQGMSEVVVRYQLAARQGDRWASVRGNNAAHRHDLVNLLRRVSIALGRLHGLAHEHTRNRWTRGRCS